MSDCKSGYKGWSINMDEKAYWIGFNLVKGVGAVRLQGLLDFFGNLEMAWNAPYDALRQAGLSEKIVEQFLVLRKQVDLSRIMERIDQAGIRVFTWNDEDYPRRLREIDQSPPVLYCQGTIEPEDEWAVAIVGTRRISAYGRQVTQELSAFLARRGVTVVSGLARGVDALAHQTAIQNGGRTFAILGSGVDKIYPPEHRKLAQEISERGAVISDYAPGTPPDGSNFPPRNRIISGLTLATVVIEAGETSGALITANFAANQGRDVFAVPGSIYAPQSIGTNRLMQDGARPLLKMDDVLESLNLQNIFEKQTARRVLPGDEVEARLLKCLSREPLHIDEISANSGLSIDKVSATLVMMELKGMVQQVGGMNYVSIQEPNEDYRTVNHA